MLYTRPEPRETRAGWTPYGVVVSEPRQPSGRESSVPPLPARLAAGLLLAQVVGFVAAAVFYVVEGLQGLGEDGARVVMSVVLFLVLAAGLFTVARGLARGAAWARTPALVWNAVLLPIAWNLTEAGAYGWAALLCAVALVGLVGILAAGRGRQD